MVKSIVCLALATEMLTMNLAQPTGLTVEQLENGLKKDLVPLASTFVEIEEEYGINSALYASIVALESGWGTSRLAKRSNNITSATVNGKRKSYETKEECLEDMALCLQENYFDEEGKFYDGGTDLDDIVPFYLLGKPKDELSRKEQKNADDYTETVEGIYRGILKRAKEEEEQMKEIFESDDGMLRIEKSPARTEPKHVKPDNKELSDPRKTESR